MKLHKSIIFIYILFLTLSLSSFAKPPSKTINDSWYTMQSGKTPWGYLHEVIEEKDSKLYYKYEMKKIEQEIEYQENLGAIAELDLKPITFNLSKAGIGATEVINGSYAQEDGADFIKVDITGARNNKFRRNLAKDAFFEVFLPVWVKKNWSKIQPPNKGKLKVFTEDPTISDFLVRDVYYTSKALNSKDKCLEIEFLLGNIASVWCISEAGVMQWMDINNHQIIVKKSKNEAEAKRYIGK